MKSRIARAVAAAALILLTAACNMSVRISTNVDTRGRGTFGIGMALDREARGALEDKGLSAIQGLFDRLRTLGWNVSTTEPDGGLALQATRTFKDQKGFEQALSELGGAQSATSPLGGISTALSHSDGFLRTHTDFHGSVDMSNLKPILMAALGYTEQQAQDVIDNLANSFQFEIQAKLPGSVAIRKGDGTVTDGTAVWSPKLGSRLDFEASSSAVKTGSLLSIGIPALLLLGGLGWFLLGRRQRPLIAEAPTPADRRRITLPTGGPAPELLAIKPEMPADVPIVIDLNETPSPEHQTVPPADATS